MKSNQSSSALFAVLLFCACNNGKQGLPTTRNETPDIRIDIIDPEALMVLDSAARIEVIGEGFKWTEGPLYIEKGNYLLFSDVMGNKVYKWTQEGASTYLTPSGKTGPLTNAMEPGSNGLLLNHEGSLVLCQHGDRRIAKMVPGVGDPKPEFVTIVDNYEGKRFNSPNDAVFHSNGDLYFTDPPYGLENGIKDSLKELDFQGVYRLKPNGQLDIVTKELEYPNGIALSPDEKFLFVASSDADNYVWMQYELDSGGLLKNGKIFYEAHAYEGKDLGAPDGLKINRQGFIFASGPEGLWVFNKNGKLVARLYTGQLTSNCAFSPDEKTLYLTCDDYLMRVKVKS